MERRDGQGNWIDITNRIGADGVRLPVPGRRLCAADIEGDGDIDLVLVGGGLFTLLNNGGRLGPEESP